MTDITFVSASDYFYLLLKRRKLDFSLIENLCPFSMASKLERRRGRFVLFLTIKINRRPLLSLNAELATCRDIEI